MKLTNLPPYELGQVVLPEALEVGYIWFENGDVEISGATDDQIEIIQTAIHTAAGPAFLATWQAGQSARDALKAEMLAATEFANLPAWALGAAAETQALILSLVFAGKTLAQVHADIDGLPANIAGMKTGLKSAATEMINIRTILVKMALTIVYLRNRTIPH